MKSKTAEEILDEKFLRVEAADWYIPVLTAMEEYASQFQHPVPDEAGRYKYLLEDFKEQYGRWYKPSFEMQSTAVPTDYTKDWTNDANEAMKWDNKLDAINFRDKVFKDMDGYEITEHEFVFPAPPSGEDAGKGIGDLKQDLFDFFLWFRENGDLYIDKSIENMISIYIKTIHTNV